VRAQAEPFHSGFLDPWVELGGPLAIVVGWLVLVQHLLRPGQLLAVRAAHLLLVVWIAYVIQLPLMTAEGFMSDVQRWKRPVLLQAFGLWR
jgi:hypothetical protein